MTKLKIDIRNGVVEVEGEESFVKEIYNDYKEKLAKVNIPEEDISGIKKSEKEIEPDVKIDDKQKVKKTAKKGGPKRKDTHSIVQDLDLSSKGQKESLKTFYENKAPENALQKNTVFVYYLVKIANQAKIGPNHIYTCYKNIGERVPGALRQSLLDTSFKKGWINTSSMEDITISVHGENLVEQDLPVPTKKDDK